MKIMLWLLGRLQLGRLGISSSPSGFVMTLCRLVCPYNTLSVLCTGKPVLSTGTNLITNLGKFIALPIKTFQRTIKVGVLEFGA